ncbi:MAG: cyd operon protein YbgT [Gammaproteobacteria bacterium RIFCSPHIGHO2_12_FULL_41_20]|nr:MAG: cyd operon protein YbgT [Gammaproteobacteria bacterium RIFCSPHIGHO2_12_FULL_41_20]
MWYFSWILGVSFACCFAILNALWLELEHSDTDDKQ